MAGLDDDQPADFYYQDELYVDRPDENFSCPICLCLVQREAHLTECCGRHFCFACIVRIRNERKLCPMCKSAPLAIFPNKERQREIKQLQVRCPLSLPPYRQLLSGRGPKGSPTAHEAKESSSTALTTNRESSTTERREAGSFKRTDIEDVSDTINKLSDFSISTNTATSRTSINDALLKGSTDVRDADDLYDSTTKSSSYQICENSKSKLGEEYSRGERTEECGVERVNLASKDEACKDIQQIFDEGERKQGVKTSTGDDGIDRIHSDDSKREVVTEKGGIKSEISKVENKVGAESGEGDGNSVYCDWKGELGQVERHVKDMHGPEALKRITKEDDSMPSSAKPCPVHGHQHQNPLPCRAILITMATQQYDVEHLYIAYVQQLVV